MVRGILKERGSYLIEALALEALQEATEMVLVQIFEDSVLFTLHGNRVTLTSADLQLSTIFQNATLAP